MASTALSSAIVGTSFIRRSPAPISLRSLPSANTQSLFGLKSGTARGGRVTAMATYKVKFILEAQAALINRALGQAGQLVGGGARTQYSESMGARTQYSESMGARTQYSESMGARTQYSESMGARTQYSESMGGGTSSG
nr:CTP-Linker [synthetic construct]